MIISTSKLQELVLADIQAKADAHNTHLNIMEFQFIGDSFDKED